MTPAWLSKDPGSVIVREVAELNNVASFREPAFALEFPTNPVPVTATVRSDGLADCAICEGDSPAITGLGLFTENAPPSADPPPGTPFRTPICGVPESCRKAPDIVPVN
jgi:hypothetical protein